LIKEKKYYVAVVWRMYLLGGEFGKMTLMSKCVLALAS